MLSRASASTAEEGAPLLSRNTSRTGPCLRERLGQRDRACQREAWPPHPEEVALGVRRRQGGRTLIGGRSFAAPTQPAKQIGPRGVERVVVVQLQLVHQCQRGSGAPCTSPVAMEPLSATTKVGRRRPAALES